MAPTSKVLSFFFSFLFLLLSQEAQARSFFFSKVANVDNLNSEELPHKVTNVVTTKQEKKEPTFVPQTQNGYGLYGHDSTDQIPSTTYEARNDESFTTTHYNSYNNDDNNNYKTNEQNEMSDTRLATQKRGYTTIPSSQNSYYNGERQGMSDTRFTQQRGYTTSTTTTPTSENINNNNYYNVERQGMSDTRFLENGKYYYDLESENNYNQKNQYTANSQALDSSNWYNNNNNNNNNKGYYDRNNRNQKVINYENNDVYQNEEFQGNEDDQYVP